MPRAFSSGALSIWSYAMNVAPPVSARIFVIAAVSDVLPWSTCPIVPMFTCGFVRSNFAFAIWVSGHSSEGALRRSRVFLLHFRGHGRRNLLVVVELHGVGRPALAHGPERVHIAEHVG